jgi:hypothetical protein
MRANLLASAMAAIFVGRRANNAVSQGRCLLPWILAYADDGERAGHEQAGKQEWRFHCQIPHTDTKR